MYLNVLRCVVSERMLVSACASSGRRHNCQCVTSLAPHCYAVALLKDTREHMTWHTHTHIHSQWTEAPASITHWWKNRHTCMLSEAQEEMYTHAACSCRPEEGWGWWQSLSLCQCQSLKRNEPEWHWLPSGDTQPVIAKWHKRPTFLSSPPFPIACALSSTFVHLVLL